MQAPTPPCDLRAPGHLAATLAERSAELVLEPDALLVLPARKLRECTRSIDVDDPFAVCERVDRPPAGDPLRVSFSAPVEGARLAWVGVEPGARGHCEPTDIVPLGSALPGLVLR